MAMLESTITMSWAENRPCWVHGEKALFHRWVDSARPVKPRGMEEEETADRYQVYNVHGLVEYEDGTMARVWPSDIQFADGGRFAEYDWDTMERHRDERAAQIEDQIRTVAHKTEKTCMTCAHADGLEEVLEKCESANYLCTNCTNEGCPCKKCEKYSNYEPKEAGHGDN